MKINWKEVGKVAWSLNLSLLIIIMLLLNLYMWIEFNSKTFQFLFILWLIIITSIMANAFYNRFTLNEKEKEND